MVTPTFREERALLARGFLIIAGVDEVGCGCLAGPVYAGAVILPLTSRIGLIRDSKLLSAAQRERVAEQIQRAATDFAVGSASVEEIDAMNIRRAAGLAMRRAIEALHVVPQYVLVDAFRIPGVRIPHKNIIRGDRYVKSIAAASIIAKVARDKYLQKLDSEYPDYGFAQHKGYGTRQHQNALRRLGPSKVHRKSFAPVRELF